MVQIIPAILTSDIHELADLLEKADDAPRVQVDIIDGKYTDNTTITPEELKGLHPKPLLDFHLMVVNPIDWIDRCLHAGADRVIGQIEHMDSQLDFVEKLLSLNIKVGLAIDLDTNLEKLDQELLPKLSCILIMSVPAGFGGQRFNLKALDKMQELKKIKEENNYDYSICDDGGVTIHLIDDAHYVGADEVAIGRNIFDGDVVENITRFQKAAHLLRFDIT